MTDSPPADPGGLDAFLAELGRLNIDDLLMIALPEPDPDERTALLERAIAAADAAGRHDAVVAAPAKARDQLFRAWSRRGLDPTWFGLNWGRSLGRADDRARLAAAVEDAAVASVVGDVLPAEDIGALREPFDLAASMAGAGPDTNPSSRGQSRRRPVVILALFASLFASLLTGALVIAGAVLTAVALVTRRGRPKS